VRVGPEFIQLDADAPGDADAPVLCRVKVVNEPAIVPDLERLERAVADLLGSDRDNALN
jgi:hypothetical protein